MKSIRMQGKNVEDAIEAAVSALGVAREVVDVQVIEEGGGGVLGFGGKSAEVEVSLKISEQVLAQQVLQEILDRMGFVTLVDLVEVLPESIKLEIRGEELAPIIGKNGATLDSLQYLMTTIVSRRSGRRVRVQVEAAAYRERQAQRIENMARHAADEAMREAHEITLPPMSAAERRLIHMAIQDCDGVTSFSRGEGKERFVVIVPAPRNA